ncbi:type III-B CRISPR module RAMP protein Cmr6 [Myxococcota bacterium]|nr:type III-B CRISPR module RAMP protein Cmr6 [Myxococcota bacterium]
MIPGVRPLPKAVAEALGDAPGPQDNLSLWLDRFLPRDPRDFSFTAAQRRDALAPFEGRRQSPGARDALARRTRHVSANPDAPGPWLLRAARALAGRALPGGGAGGAMELSLGLDPRYGAPRLAGSALKGLARTVAEADGWPADKLELVFGRGVEDDPRPATDLDQRFDRATWRPKTKEWWVEEGAQAGLISFLDALPENGRFQLAVDGLTPHMGPWYRGEVDAPVEWLSPVPVSFLAVTKTSFVIDVMVWLPPDPSRRQDLITLTHDALHAALRGLVELGIGGKTAAGYGYFEEA